jgi:hypothetical protein
MLSRSFKNYAFGIEREQTQVALPIPKWEENALGALMADAEAYRHLRKRIRSSNYQARLKTNVIRQARSFIFLRELRLQAALEARSRWQQ